MSVRISVHFDPRDHAALHRAAVAKKLSLGMLIERLCVEWLNEKNMRTVATPAITEKDSRSRSPKERVKRAENPNQLEWKW
jgi:hypothetical protein